MNIRVKTAAAGRGLGWISDGLGFFTRNPLGWIAAMIVVFIIMLVIGVMPIGSLLLYFLYPVFIGGFMIGCKAHMEGQQFEFQHAFAGFSSAYLVRLLIYGLIYTILNILLIIVLLVLMFFMLGGLEFFQEIQNMQPEDVTKYASQLGIVALVASLLFLPLLMASWFAPALLVHTECKPVEALLLSLKACIYNVPAFTLYGIALLVLSVLAAIPLGLGYLMLTPVILASIYLAYLDCFEYDADDSPKQVIASTDSGVANGPD